MNNLTELFEIQRKLDAEIEKKHPVAEGDDRLADRVLALLVEIGELANELPEVFKFWSNKKNNYEKALEEYVDGIHFLLSIGLVEGPEKLNDPPILVKNKSVRDCFLDIYEEVSEIEWSVDAYVRAFYRYVELGEKLGFTWEQIESAYMAKNAINHQRQETGY